MNLAAPGGRRSNDAQIAIEEGLMIAEVNMAIGAIDRILKMIRDGKSNKPGTDECPGGIRPLANAPAESRC